MSAMPENSVEHQLPSQRIPQSEQVNHSEALNQSIDDGDEGLDEGPPVPRSLEETGLEIAIVEELILKIMLAKGAMSGRDISEDICLHFSIIEKIMADLKARLFVAHKDNAGMGDFTYILSDLGKETALKAREISAYTGSAPVPEPLRRSRRPGHSSPIRIRTPKQAWRLAPVRREVLAGSDATPR